MGGVLEAFHMEIEEEKTLHMDFQKSGVCKEMLKILEKNVISDRSKT